MIKSRVGPPSLYCPLYTYLNVGTPRKPERTIGDLIELGYVQYEARKEEGDDCKLLPCIRYFQQGRFGTRGLIITLILYNIGVG